MVKAKKSLGQNFLIDERITRRILEAVDPSPSDILIEIGPGRGALTRHLLKRGGDVYAIEIDSRLLEGLRKDFPQPEFHLVQADALALDWEALIDSTQQNRTKRILEHQEGARVRVVANLPYYVATSIVEKLLKLKTTLHDLTLMLQDEVVDRMTSAPGSREYGYLSLLVHYYAVAEKLFSVPACAFSPPPKVTSAVVRLTVRNEKPIVVDDEERFFVLIRAAFAQRRKTIQNNLKAANSYLAPLLAIGDALECANLDGGRRAETLSLEEFGQLYRALFEARK